MDMGLTLANLRSMLKFLLRQDMTWSVWILRVLDILRVFVVSLKIEQNFMRKDITSFKRPVNIIKTYIKLSRLFSLWVTVRVVHLHMALLDYFMRDLNHSSLDNLRQYLTLEFRQIIGLRSTKLNWRKNRKTLHSKFHSQQNLLRIGLSFLGIIKMNFNLKDLTMHVHQIL